jgi:hypothetical protein
MALRFQVPVSGLQSVRRLSSAMEAKSAFARKLGEEDQPSSLHWDDQSIIPAVVDALRIGIRGQQTFRRSAGAAYRP